MKLISLPQQALNRAVHKPSEGLTERIPSFEPAERRRGIVLNTVLSVKAGVPVTQGLKCFLSALRNTGWLKEGFRPRHDNFHKVIRLIIFFDSLI